ncbi:MAG: hypothetical protein K2Q20_02345, partial [Phycisphaerales bacterium]|nr:hypothetical protein [Phycisphaerales bacterium]
MRRATRILVAVWAGLGVMAAARAQDDPKALAAVEALRAYYSTSDVCERVGIEIASPGPTPTVPVRRTRSSVIVRLSSGERGGRVAPPTPPTTPTPTRATATGDDVGRMVALDLGQLRLVAADGLLVAAHAANQSTFARWTLTGSGGGRVASRDLEGVVPSVLVPQVDLAAEGAGGVVRSLGSFARGITWTGVEPDTRQPSRVTISGVFEHGRVQLVAGAGRLKTMVIERPDQGVTITMNISSLSPCEPRRALIDVERRTRVEGLDELKPKGYTLRIGVKAPEMPLSRVSGEKWTLDEVLAPPSEAAVRGVPSAEHAVLVFVRSLRPGVATGLPRFDPAKLAGILGPMREATFAEVERDRGAGEPAQDGPPRLARFGLAPVLVVTGLSADELLTRLKDAGRVWGRDVMWTTDPAASIDLFAPGGEAAIAVIDSEKVVRGVVVVEPSMTTEQVAEQVEA